MFSSKTLISFRLNFSRKEIKVFDGRKNDMDILDDMEVSKLSAKVYFIFFK